MTVATSPRPLRVDAAGPSSVGPREHEEQRCGASAAPDEDSDVVDGRDPLRQEDGTRRGRDNNSSGSSPRRDLTKVWQTSWQRLRVMTLLSLGDCPRGVDQTDVAESLREVSDQLTSGDVDLL